MLFSTILKDNIFDFRNWKIIKVSNSITTALVGEYEQNKNDNFVFESQGTIQERTKIINRIKKDKQWLDLVKKQAKGRNISLDSMLVLSADYICKKN